MHENRTVDPPFVPIIDDISISFKFIGHVKNSSLEDYLDQDAIDWLWNPPEEELTLDDPDHRYSIKVFLVITTASEATYNAVHLATLCRYSDSSMLTYYKVKCIRNHSPYNIILGCLSCSHCAIAWSPITLYPIVRSCGSVVQYCVVLFPWYARLYCIASL